MNRELRRQIATQIREFLEKEPPDSTLHAALDSDLRAVVSKLNVLPLLLDMGGCYALNQDGDVISFAWDNEMDMQIELDPRIRSIALFQGSRKYPELEVLIPARPTAAPDCHVCKGTGGSPADLCPAPRQSYLLRQGAPYLII